MLKYALFIFLLNIMGFLRLKYIFFSESWIFALYIEV